MPLPTWPRVASSRRFPRLEGIEERLWLSGSASRLAIQWCAAHQQRGERLGERAHPGVEVDGAPKALEPTHPEPHVGDLFATDDLLNASPLFVVRFPKACCERCRVLEV